MRNVYRISVRNLKERDHMGDLGSDEKLIFTQLSRISLPFMEPKVHYNVHRSPPLMLVFQIYEA
jgi:hypothetical protein